MEAQIIFFKRDSEILLFLLLLFVACGCVKDDSDELPPITQTGANTFACVYDGVVFVPSSYKSSGFGTGGGGAPISVFGDKQGTEHHSSRIIADRGSNVKNLQYIQIYIYQLPSLGVGTYPVGESVKNPGYDYATHSYIQFRGISPSTGVLTQYFSYEKSGEIIVTRKDENIIIMNNFLYVLYDVSWG